jgi:hypothetical protein
MQFISNLFALESSHIYRYSFETASQARGSLFGDIYDAIPSVSQFNYQRHTTDAQAVGKRDYASVKLFLELNSDEINSRIPVVTNLNVI